MSFVTQEDVFAAVEPVLHGVFEEFGEGRTVTPCPFPRIPFDESMLKYGSDKPDLRNPIVIADASHVFRGSGFSVFANAVENERKSVVSGKSVAVRVELVGRLFVKIKKTQELNRKG